MMFSVLAFFSSLLTIVSVVGGLVLMVLAIWALLIYIRKNR